MILTVNYFDIDFGNVNTCFYANSRDYERKKLNIKKFVLINHYKCQEEIEANDSPIDHS